MHKILLALLPFIVQTAAANSIDQCLLSTLKSASAETTIAEIRSLCAKPQLQTESISSSQPLAATQEPVRASITTRTKSEDANEKNPFSLTAYRPNYILMASYNDKINEEAFTNIFPDANMDHTEAKFQISFKARMAKGVLGGELWGAFTQQSWWQLFNSDESAPFRETNYEPEIYLRWVTNYEILGFTNRTLQFGFNHESNGRGTLLSRSWNRLMAGATFERGNLAINSHAWYRIPEEEEDDDNPNINEYMGYGDLQLLYKWDQQNIGLTLLNNLRSDNKG
ncbi:MAG: phospholipase A1, partial [Pseudohongiellaceae bacterium]